ERGARPHARLCAHLQPGPQWRGGRPGRRRSGRGVLLGHAGADSGPGGRDPREGGAVTGWRRGGRGRSVPPGAADGADASGRETAACVTPKATGEDLSTQADEAAGYLKALAHEGRLMILCHLLDGEKSVTELESLLASRQAANRKST